MGDGTHMKKINPLNLGGGVSKSQARSILHDGVNFTKVNVKYMTKSIQSQVPSLVSFYDLHVDPVNPYWVTSSGPRVTEGHRPGVNSVDLLCRNSSVGSKRPEDFRTLSTPLR